MNYTTIMLNSLSPKVKHLNRYPITLSTLSSTLNMTEYSLKKELELLETTHTRFINSTPGGGYSEVQVVKELPHIPAFVNITSLPYTERRALTYFYVKYFIPHGVNLEEEVTYKNCKYFLDVGENLFYKMITKLLNKYDSKLTEQLFEKQADPLVYDIGDNIIYQSSTDNFIYERSKTQ